MSPPEVWGPPIWTFLHTLAEKIKEDQYQILGTGLVFHIKRIVSHLPCPDCSRHASRFLNSLPPERLSNKTDLKNALYILHNSVNRRKNKPLQPLTFLDNYKQKNVVKTYEDFIKVYKTRGNMKLLTDSFQRQLIVHNLKKWLLTNLHSFN
jgi:hypothetical protein